MTSLNQELYSSDCCTPEAQIVFQINEILTPQKSLLNSR